MNAKKNPKTEDVQPVRCVWAGGGFKMWELRDSDGVHFFRLSKLGRWVGDFDTEEKATDAIVTG